MTNRGPFHPTNLGRRPDPRGYFEGCKVVHENGCTVVVYCPVCRTPVREWFGVERCGCQEPHSHLP